jgi:hypothetical protein
VKAECPVCGCVGVLQNRATTTRIQHYVGFKDGKRVYQYHKIDGKTLEVKNPDLGLDSELLEVNRTQKLEVKKDNLVSKSEIMARDVGIEPTRPFDHRLSRPAPYQAWGIPHAQI